MRTAVIAGIAAAIGALGGALALGARPAVAGPPAPGLKWEYHVEVVSIADYKDSDEYKALEKDLQNPWRAQFAFHERVLARAGAEGWDLVQIVVPKSPAETIFYLRRPKVD